MAIVLNCQFIVVDLTHDQCVYMCCIMAASSRCLWCAAAWRFINDIQQNNSDENQNWCLSV